MPIDNLIELWQDAKQREQEAQAERRNIEDLMIKQLKIDETKEGTSTFGNLKVTCRHNQTIDSNKLQDIAKQNGIDCLSMLFRWKPEIDKKAWAIMPEEITRPLLAAITTKPGRPSFSIKDN